MVVARMAEKQTAAGKNPEYLVSEKRREENKRKFFPPFALRPDPLLFYGRAPALKKTVKTFRLKRKHRRTCPHFRFPEKNLYTTIFIQATFSNCCCSTEK